MEQEQFYSILFESTADEVSVSDEPSFFVDLNLRRIVYDVIPDKADDAVVPFFYAPLRSADAVRYRLEVFQALEDPALYGEIAAFLFAFKQVTAALSNSANVRTESQKDKWLIDAARLYCACVRRLEAFLSAHPSASRGLTLLSRYLSEYTASAPFLALEEHSARAAEQFEAIRYSVHFFEDKLLIDFAPDDRLNLHRDFRQVFAHLTDTPVDSTLAFFTGFDLTPLEQEIIRLFAKRFPEAFENLSQAARKCHDFIAPPLERLASELRFYTLYHAFMRKMRERGMTFAYPEILDHKELHVTGGYDLALAVKHEDAAQVIVSNDFYLDPQERIMILAGPNQGGKTTFARSFGQMMYLASLGLPVPARSASLWLIRSLYTHFAVEEDLSSHSGRLQEELLRLSGIVKAADKDSLLLFNELFATTTTYDALRLGLRVLRWVDRLDAVCLYVSHIADLAENFEKAVSMVAEVVSPDNPIRTYRISRRAADGEAYANSIARKYALTYHDICRRKGLEAQK